MKEKTIFALGFFDGVHLGHQALLKACKELAQENNCFSGVVTFTSHPKALLCGNAPVLINTIEDRKRLLFHYGIESVVYMPFDEALRDMHWQTFLEKLLMNDAGGFVCGSDFRFGAGGQGTAEKLREFCREQNLPCSIVPQQLVDGIRVSSTYIRTLLEAGDMEEVNRFLGHPHSLTGTVIPGRQLGRTIGIPTANLELPEYLVQPKFGVYACTVITDGKEYAAVTNIGTRPTVEGHHVTVEPWILDFDGDLYGKTITLTFHEFLRPEQKFPSLDELKAQIQKDAVKTREMFEKTKKN